MSLNVDRQRVASGVWWIGDIPENWSVWKFRHLFHESSEKIEDEVVGVMLSVSGYRGIEVKNYDDENRRRTDDDLVGYRIVRHGQLVVNTMWLNYAGLGVSDFEGHVSPAYRSYNFQTDVDRRYIHHLMRSSVYVQGYTRLLTGIRPNSLQMSRDDLMDFPILLPPLRDQTAIAAFLDRETGKIDALVEEQRRLIELLKEKRQAVISHAVTKGLDPNAKMKPSGVEWLGDVPEHWEVRRIKHLSSLISKGTTPTTIGADFTSEGVRFLKAENLSAGAVQDQPEFFISEETHEQLGRSQLRAGDVLVVIAGATTGKSAVLSPAFVPANTNQAVAFIRPATPMNSQWINLWLSINAVQQSIALGSVQSAQPNLAMEDLGNIPIFCPPQGEASEILRQLSADVQQLDELCDYAGVAIALLQERRSAMISAAVTGKLDVRETVSAPAVGAINVDRIRLLVAAEIVDLLSHKRSFGRVKLQKLLYLAEAEAGISELQGQYQREAAGPLDRSLIADVDAALQQGQHVSVVQSDGPGSQVVYHLHGLRGAYHDELVASIGGRAETLRALVEKLGDLDTKSIEAVATLYAVWNDALLDHQEPTDAMVVSGMLEDWHPEKARKFKAEELLTWLGWMRRTKLVPRGNGPRTTTGRLFS